MTTRGQVAGKMRDTIERLRERVRELEERCRRLEAEAEDKSKEVSR